MTKYIPAAILFAASAAAAPDFFGGGAQNLANPEALSAENHAVTRAVRSVIIDVPDTPTPEPATWLLMGGGLAGLALARRRLKK